MAVTLKAALSLVVLLATIVFCAGWRSVLFGAGYIAVIMAVYFIPLFAATAFIEGETSWRMAGPRFWYTYVAAALATTLVICKALEWQALVVFVSGALDWAKG